MALNATLLAFVALAISGPTALAAAQTPPAYEADAAPGPFTPEAHEGVWIDTARQDRAVPYRLTLGADNPDPAPVIVFSHGLGGSVTAAEFLARHLASHGYGVVNIQHPGSDIDAAWDVGLFELLRVVREEPGRTRARFQDVPFAIDQIEAMAGEGPFAGRLDPQRLGMAGHSFGAITTQAMMGQAMGGRAVFAEPRFDAAIAYSPAPARGVPTQERAFRDLRGPFFHVTGTQDETAYRDFEPIARRQPFDAAPANGQYLLILKEANHSTFTGVHNREDPDYTDGEYRRDLDILRIATRAFWDAHLKADPAARAFLDAGGLARALDEGDVFEAKLSN